jgi:hypothetical protein
MGERISEDIRQVAIRFDQAVKQGFHSSER